jgi:RNA polymerase sigma-70 factor, ECF subfamily
MTLPENSWVEHHRAYLRDVATSHLGRGLSAKVDLSGLVQKTMEECWPLPAPPNAKEEQALMRKALMNNLLDSIRYWKAAKRDYRREVPTGQADTDTPLDLVECLSTPSEKARRNESEVELATALTQLPEDQRLAVFLHHLLERSLAEVADEMQRTEASVAGLLRRGLQNLRTLLPSGGQ